MLHVFWSILLNVRPVKILRHLLIVILVICWIILLMRCFIPVMSRIRFCNWNVRLRITLRFIRGVLSALLLIKSPPLLKRLIYGILLGILKIVVKHRRRIVIVTFMALLLLMFMFGSRLIVLLLQSNRRMIIFCRLLFRLSNVLRRRNLILLVGKLILVRKRRLRIRCGPILFGVVMLLGLLRRLTLRARNRIILLFVKVVILGMMVGQLFVMFVMRRW